MEGRDSTNGSKRYKKTRKHESKESTVTEIDETVIGVCTVPRASEARYLEVVGRRGVLLTVVGLVEA